MSNKLIIVCVECAKNSPSDQLYIRKLIENVFSDVIESRKVTLKYIFLGGKSKYNRVATKIRETSNGFEKKKCSVIFCFDTDDEDISNEDKSRNNNIKYYCEKNDYHLVWFKREIEEVFLEKRLSNDKLKEAVKFYKGDMIKNIDFKKLSEINENGTSNILEVLNTVFRN